MAGVKGKSGGPRKNAGGARVGAGRKPKAAPTKSANTKAPAARTKSAGSKPAGGAPKEKAPAPPVADLDMLQFLKDVALGLVTATPTQVRAAIAAVQYTHTKKGDGGKKDERLEKAKAASAGKFAAPPPPPRLVHSGRK